jgi:hypothetical protein
MHAVRNSLAPALAFVMVMITFERQAPLDPDQPLAADSSLTAGRARTIFQFDPLLGAFDENRQVDPDDPHEFEDYFALESTWVDRSRDAIVDLIEPVDAVLCEPDRRKRLIAAIQTYYDTRSRQKAGFRLLGPRASRFIEQTWSTTTDHQIDSFVRQLVTQGFVQAPEISARSYPDLLDVIAHISSRATARVRGLGKRTTRPNPEPNENRFEPDLMELIMTLAKHGLRVLVAIVIAAWTSCLSSAEERTDVNTDRREEPVRIQVSINSFFPGSTGESDDAIKLRERVRRSIYEMAAGECGLVQQVLAKTCRLESVNVNRWLHGERYFALRITLK